LIKIHYFWKKSIVTDLAVNMYLPNGPLVIFKDVLVLQKCYLRKGALLIDVHRYFFPGKTLGCFPTFLDGILNKSIGVD